MDNTKLSFFRKIYLWWKFEARYYHKDFTHGVKNLIRWFPVIWKDRDWDDHYIWEIWKKKLSFQAEHIYKHGHHVNNVYDAERMRICVRLIDDIQHEFYSSEFMDYHESKMHFTPSEKYPEYSTVETTELWEKFDDYFAKYPHAYREVTKTDRYIFDNDSKQKIAMNMGYYLHKKANRILFKLLERHLESWWD